LSVFSAAALLFSASVIFHKEIHKIYTCNTKDFH